MCDEDRAALHALVRNPQHEKLFELLFQEEKGQWRRLGDLLQAAGVSVVLCSGEIYVAWLDYFYAGTDRATILFYDEDELGGVTIVYDRSWRM